MTVPSYLEEARITALPPSSFYIPNFITPEEEETILNKVATVPRPRWKQLTHRRLQAWPSELVRNRLLDEPLPPWLENPIIPRLKSMAFSEIDPSHLFDASPHQKPNHVLINEYPPGVGIMPHKDGSAYWPVVCTISLGASLCLDLYRSKEDGGVESVPTWRILQEPRSLLITTEDLYTDYLHGIASISEDLNLDADSIANWSLLGDPSAYAKGTNLRQTRTSLTYRDVLSVSKIGNKFKLGLMGQR